MKEYTNQDKNSKPLNEMEYHEYIRKKTITVNTIKYPDGSKGELNKGVIVLDYR